MDGKTTALVAFSKNCLPLMRHGGVPNPVAIQAWRQVGQVRIAGALALEAPVVIQIIDWLGLGQIDRLFEVSFDDDPFRLRCNHGQCIRRLRPNPGVNHRKGPVAEFHWLAFVANIMAIGVCGDTIDLAHLN